MGQLIFGYQVSGYHSFTSSFSKLFSFIGGTFDYDELNNASPVAGVVFFFSFMVLVFLILVNVFIAIISKYYNEAHAEASKREQEMKTEASLTPEENFGIYTKLRKLKLYLVLAGSMDQSTPLSSRGPVSAESFLQTRTPLRKGARVTIWLFRSGGEHFGGDENYTSGAHGTRWSPNGEELSTLECIARGRATYRRFLPEILSEGDCVYLKSAMEQQCRLKVLKVMTNTRGQYIDFEATDDVIIHNWTQIKVPLRVALRYALIQYLAPTLSRNYVASRTFRLFNVKPPPTLYTTFEIEDRILRLVKANEKRRLEDAQPLKLDFEYMLQEIRGLDRAFATGRKEMIKVDRARFEELVNRAVAIDQLLTSLRSSLKASSLNSSDAPLSTLDLFVQLNEEADNLETLLKDQWNIKRQKEPPMESLRFDEVCRQLRLLLSFKNCTGISNVDIKKAAVKMLSMFPLDCFDSLDASKEHELYVPRPYDTSQIQDTDIDPILLLGDLVETLGEIIHDNWSLSKLKRGWRYGPTRNDEQKTSPCLLPFLSLPHSEKKYDLDMVCSTLRVVILLGYDIRRPPKGSVSKNLIPMPEQEPFKRMEVPPIPDGYVLKMIDTSNVLLNDDLVELTDLLAENAHDVWAFKRKQEGWRYGLRQDDKEKTSPLIMPYGLMTEEDKALDFNTITEIIKSVVALEYTIERSGSRTFWQRILGTKPSL